MLELAHAFLTVQRGADARSCSNYLLAVALLTRPVGSNAQQAVLGHEQAQQCVVQCMRAMQPSLLAQFTDQDISNCSYALGKLSVCH